jgi:uncharacterized protein
MLAGIAIAAAGAGIRVHAAGFALAQGIIGCLIARIAPLSIASELFERWPLFVFGVLAVIAASMLLGWVMMRMRILPGTAVLWGASPGAATAMIVMAESYGADARLVAFMQYLRVALVAAFASIVAKIWGLTTASHGLPDIDPFPTIHWLSFAETLALAMLGPLIGEKLRIRSGPLIIPLVVGVILVHLGWLQVELPPWLLVLSYAIVGWSIGLRFTNELLLHVAKAFPRVLASMVALILLCALLAAVLVALAGVSPLTAYLATSPGGADSVAIIAASSNVAGPSNVDISFVMAMQTTRLVAIIFLAPLIAKLAPADPPGPG